MSLNCPRCGALLAPAFRRDLRCPLFAGCGQVVAHEREAERIRRTTYRPSYRHAAMVGAART